MASNENYQAPFDVDSEATDPDLVEATEAWLDDELGRGSTAMVDQSIEFVGQWNRLVSQTNWEKGRIINQWRTSLIASEAPSSAYSDEAWANRVGGVTAPHVGRLRRVFERFNATFETYPQLSWTHFLAAMDWDDAPLWLQGANDGGWSISGMRKQRWEATGGDPNDQPRDSDLVTTDIDEDFAAGSTPDEMALANSTQPAQGGGTTKKYDDEPNTISSGPTSEGPDFGDEESLNRFSSDAPPQTSQAVDDDNVDGVLVQPFAGLPPLPDDLADAVELLKLAIVRHKATGWQAVDAETIRTYLSAFLVLVDARSR